jgi:MFS family permease
MLGKLNTLVAVAIATFMLLEVTVVNVALPEIQADLGTSFDQLQWLIDAYALTLAATMLIFGSLADRLRRRNREATRTSPGPPRPRSSAASTRSCWSPRWSPFAGAALALALVRARGFIAQPEAAPPPAAA